MFRIRTTRRIAAIITLLSTAALPQTGLAASYLDTIRSGAQTTYTASLFDMTQNQSSRTTRTLDWRQSSIELYFDLPPSEKTSEIVLTLSADPLTRVAKNAPLLVQFNNGDPVPVVSNGRGFEARLPLDAKKSRDYRNVLRITYPTPEGADCVSPDHGAWSIDLADSTLRMKGRARSSNMSLSDVKAFLAQPALSPNTVGLVASGPDGTDMLALAAQGVSLRTPSVPKFSITSTRTDFNVVMVKRGGLSDVTDDPMILNSKGPRIFIPRGRPTELIFTADTDAEILQMLESFATRKLPTSRRSISSLGELNLQNRFNSGTFKIDGRTPLTDLAVASADNLSGAQTYKFGVADPTTTGGEVLLRLATTKNLPENSRLQVTLNGKSLGAAKLDKKRKSVAFDIQPGALNANSNVLTLIPDLQATSGYSCPSTQSAHPGFYIGEGSRLKITKTAESPATELSRMTSTGGLFASSESYIVLPRQTRDFQAALRVLGQLAKSSGQGMTSADYTRSADVSQDKHVLIIGPSDMVKNHMSGAPKAFRDALSGRSSTGDNLLQASYEQAASAGSNNAALKLAAAQSAPRNVSRGGVAALYSAGNGTLTGVITATPGASFTQASQTLIETAHWNAMRGGVARWTSSSMVMAQFAQSDAGIVQPKPEIGFKLPELGIAAIEDLGLQWPDFTWPEVEWPEFDMPQVELPEFEMPKFNWPSFKSVEAADTTIPVQPVAATSRIPVPKVKTAEVRNLGQAEKIVRVVDVAPRLKPSLKRSESVSTGLRGPFEFSPEKPKTFWSFQDIRRATIEKWSETKDWYKTKTESLSDIRTFDEVAQATDRFQTQVKPAGRSMKAAILDKFPGKGLVQFGDRTFSVYGLMLMLAFGLVLLLMSLAKPASRLGGRH